MGIWFIARQGKLEMEDGNGGWIWVDIIDIIDIY
jgi:hypothetical protein